MKLLTLVRHGQSVFNLENRFTGTVDVALTPQGEWEASQAGEKLKQDKYAEAFTSMLIRAQTTLKIILEKINQPDIPVSKNAALNERMYGSLQGLNKEQIAKKYGEHQVALWRRSFAVRPPDGESLEDTFNRVIPFYRSAIEPRLRVNENVLIVAHGNSLRALMMYLESIDETAIEQVNIPTGTPRQYLFDDDMTINSVRYL